MGNADQNEGTAHSDKIEVIAPNLNRRLSGVTSTIVRLVPLQAQKIGIVSFGIGLPDFVPKISILELINLPKKTSSTKRVWHARRNIEMLLGLVLNRLFALDFKLLFTSASQRNHTLWSKYLIRKMDRVVATSHAGEKYLEVPATVVHHGINTGQFSPAPDKDELRKNLNLPAKKFIGCIGRIRKQKGTDVFVDAMIKLLPDYPDWDAVILGRATLSHQLFLSNLEKKIEKAGLKDRFHFPAEVPTHEVSKWYQVLSLFIAPQRWEGFGLTPLEAMACGVPVVATKVGAFPELVNEGETGYLIQTNDHNQMATVARKLLDDPKRLKKFAKTARENMVENFDLNVEANKLIKIYRDMA